MSMSNIIFCRQKYIPGIHHIVSEFPILCPRLNEKTWLKEVQIAAYLGTRVCWDLKRDMNMILDWGLLAVLVSLMHPILIYEEETFF